MIKRTLTAVALFLLPLTAFAQSNEFGVFISTSQFEDAQLSEDIGDIDVEFDEDMGYGVSFNRFWTNSFSTEFAYQRLGADLTASLGNISEEAGTLDLDILSATGQLHFLRNGFLSPYVGAGVAYVSGEAGALDEDELGATDLANEVDFLVNAGLNLGLGRGLAIFVDGKYVMYAANGENDPDEDALDINPLIVSAGIKLRF
jgi:outer membrane protein W